MKEQNLKPLTVSVFFFAVACEGIFIETALKADLTGPKNITVCRRVRASFRPDISQAGAGKALNIARVRCIGRFLSKGACLSVCLCL